MLTCKGILAPPFRAFFHESLGCLWFRNRPPPYTPSATAIYGQDRLYPAVASMGADVGVSFSSSSFIPCLPLPLKFGWNWQRRGVGKPASWMASE